MSPQPTPTLQALLAHTRWVENLARSLVRDPNAAADLAQSTLLAALEQPAPAANPRAWLAHVMRNLVRERFRREASRPAAESRGAREERLPGADELVERAESERRVVAAVLALEEPHKSTLLLRYFEDLSPEVIARRSGLSLSAISSRITRAHARLRAKLADEDPRENWLAALTPILARKPDPPPPFAPNLFENLFMSTNSKVLIGLALAAALVWFTLPERESSSADSASVQAPPALETAVAPSPASPDVAAPASGATDERAAVAAAKEAPAGSASEPIVAPTPASGGRIFGQIFRPDGRPAPGRKLRMLRSNTGPEKYVTTDAEGRFDERELGIGTWSLATWPDKTELAALGKADEHTIDGFTYMTQRTVDLGREQEIEVILGKPPAAGVRAHGRMLLGGSPVEGYMTWLPDGSDSMDRQKIASVSDEKGYVTLLDTPGRYLVIAIRGEARVEFVVDVPAGPDFERDFVLFEITLRGSVTGADGEPVAGARIDLTPRAGHNPRHPAANITYSHTSGDDGEFTFSSLPPARYALAVHGNEKSKGQFAARFLGEIELNAETEPKPIEVLLEEGVVVRGTVKSATGTVAYTDVFVIDSAGEPLNPLQGVASKQDGSFELFALAPGSYRAVAAAGVLWSDVVRFTIPVQGELPTLELELKPTATLTIDIDGRQPAWIELLDSSGVHFSTLFNKHVLNRTVNRDWSSTSFVYRVPPGEYRAAVVGATGRLAEQKIVALAGESLAVDLRSH